MLTTKIDALLANLRQLAVRKHFEISFQAAGTNNLPDSVKENSKYLVPFQYNG